MKIKLDNRDSKIVKDNDTYRLLDNTELNNLVVSKTILHPGKETTGHLHAGQEEVYHFTSGHGFMEVGPAEPGVPNRKYDVSAGDIVLIPDGDFHKVWNTSETEDLIFVCTFDGKRNH